MDKDNNVIGGENNGQSRRICPACGAQMEYNPVTGGYFCGLCGRIERETESGFEEDQYRSTGKIIARTEEQTDEKCRKCGGTFRYDPESGNLVCPFCGNTVNLNLVSRGYKASENDFQKEKRRENRDWGFKTKTVVCESCGGRTVYDYLELSGKCLYCGSTQVTELKDVDTIAPGGVCPFTVDKEDAQESFRKWIRKRRFCPNDVRRNAKPGKLNGVYLPFWTFDTDTESQFTAVCKSNKSGNEQQNTGSVVSGLSGSLSDMATDILLTYAVNSANNTTTVSGTHHQFFNDVLIYASDNHDSTIIKQLEPYDTDNSLPYSPEYIAGFAAEVYSTGLDDAWEEAQKECRKKLKEAIKKRIGFEHYTYSIRSIDFETKFSEITFKYLLLPVWISSFTYKGKIYQFMVNGCTGKTGGKFPVSKAKIIAAVIGALSLAALIIYMKFFR